MNDGQPEDCGPRETDRLPDEPTHQTKMWNSSMLWEVGLILLVGLGTGPLRVVFQRTEPGSRADRWSEQGQDVGGRVPK
jgi:hypothetical protein